MMVFISNGKLHVSAYSGHHQVLTTFLLQELHIMCKIRVAPYSKKVVNIVIYNVPRRFCTLYVTLIARKLSKPDDGRYTPKHVVFHC